MERHVPKGGEMKVRRSFWVMVLMGVGLVFPACCEHKGISDTRVSDTILKHITIKATPQEVWNYAFHEGVVFDESGQKMDFEWFPGGEFTYLDGRGVGATSKYSLEMGGIKFSGESVTVEDIPTRKHVAKWEGDIEGTWTMIVVPLEKGSKLIIIDEYAFDMPEGAKVSKQALIKEGEQNTENALKAIKEKVEKR
jgi:hypothetical protein